MDFRTRYEFDAKKDFLGKGGFSKVYRANDALLERVVALKFFTSNASEKYQVLNEIKKVIRFEHPNLCKYYDVVVLNSKNIVGEQERIEVGIMEYLDAGDFKTFIAAHPEYTDKLLIDVLNGLSYLHRRGIVHRDLKPQNILIKIVDDEPVAKITDFGISKMIDGEDTHSSALMGTIEYMAPEQFNPKKYGINGKIATNIDLWSFGLLVYETINAQPLFGSRSAGVSAEQVMSNILSDTYLTKILAVPERYRAILEKCLVKNAAMRAQQATELIPLFQIDKNHVSKLWQPVAIKPAIDQLDSGRTEVLNLSEVDRSDHTQVVQTVQEELTELRMSGEQNLQAVFQDETSEIEPVVPESDKTEVFKEAAGDSEQTEVLNAPFFQQSDATTVLNAAEVPSFEPTQVIDMQPTDVLSVPESITQVPTVVLKGEEVEAVVIKAKAQTPGTVVRKDAEHHRPQKAFLSKPVLAGLLLIAVIGIAMFFYKSSGTKAPTTVRQTSPVVESAPAAFAPPQTVEVEKGTFIIGYEGKDGSDFEKPSRQIAIAGFAMGKYEVTISEFRQFVQETGYTTTAEKERSSFIYKPGDKEGMKADVNWRYDIQGRLVDSVNAGLPVVHVSWYDAEAYCKWLSQKTGLSFRLPTEAEWEFAAKGGGKTRQYKYSGGDALSDVSWNGSNSGMAYHPVGMKDPNELGLFDMSGNVNEWCADDFVPAPGGATANTAGANRSGKKVVRGGSWYPEALGDGFYRPSFRIPLPATERGAKVGFRVCRNVN